MRKYIWTAFVAMVAFGVLGGCGSGETGTSDLQKENDEMKKQTPANLAPVQPPADTVNMGGGGTAGEQSNMMPKGVRGKN